MSADGLMLKVSNSQDFSTVVTVDATERMWPRRPFQTTVWPVYTFWHMLWNLSSITYVWPEPKRETDMQVPPPPINRPRVNRSHGVQRQPRGVSLLHECARLPEGVRFMAFILSLFLLGVQNAVKSVFFWIKWSESFNRVTVEPCFTVLEQPFPTEKSLLKGLSFKTVNK